MAACQLCWSTAILFYRCSLDLLFSPPNLRGRLADRQQTLQHVLRRRRFIKFGQKFGCTFSQKNGSPKTSTFPLDFAQLRDLITNISGAQQEIVNLKTALQTTDTPAHLCLTQINTLYICGDFLNVFG